MAAFAFNQVKLNGSLLGGCSAPNYDRREVERMLANDSTLHQTGGAIIRAAPKVSFGTVAMRALFVVLGTGDEIPYVALDGVNGCELIGAKANTAGPGYLGTSTHASRKMISGDCYLSRVSWSPGDVARAEVEIFPISSGGSTDPVVAAAVALPTLAQNTEQMVLSSLALGAFSPTDIASFDIQFTHQGENNDEEICFSLGLPFPVLTKRAGTGGVTEVVMTVEVLDLTTAVANGTCTAVFTSLNVLGIGVSTPTATITLNNCIIREKTIMGADGRPAKRQITAHATYDGANKPATIATA